MLRTPPKLTYCGLTLCLANPSRFDKLNLLSGPGGQLLNDFCLRPELNKMQCDIRLAEDQSRLWPNTKVVMLLGEDAMHRHLPETLKNSIGEMRGSVFQKDGVFYIPSFFPQDAAELRNWEAEHNPLSKSYQEDDSNDDTGDDDSDSIKKHGRTSRKNYAFWLRADVGKAKKILKHGGLPPKEFPEPIYHIYPPSDEIINILTKTKGQEFFIDIETDREEQNLQCFAFTFDGHHIYSVPILNNNYLYAYSGVHRIMCALAVAMRDNVSIAHNGAAFDFFVLANKYRIAVNKCYDTMLAMHRCFPDVEHSLGHCVSYWTWENFHKDEDSSGYMTHEHMMARLKYCAKDVYTMFLVKRGIDKYSKTIPGLSDSINCVMRCIRPYLTTTIQGIRYDQQMVNEKRAENDRLMMQYIRFIDFLIGKSGMAEVKSALKGKAKAFPGSNTQCCEYFHNILGYGVVARGKLRKDGQRHPSLAAKALYKLRLNHDNPVIDFTIAYRQTALETSTPLGFIPWKDDNNKVIDWRKYDSQREQNNTIQTILPVG